MTAQWLKLIRLARPPRRALASILGLIAMTAVIDAARPWPLKWLVDHVLQQLPAASAPWWEKHLVAQPAPMTLVAVLVAGTILLFLLGQMARIAMNYLQSGFGSRITYNLAAEQFDHLQSLSLLFHSKRPAADLLRRVVTDSACVRDLFLGVLIPTAMSVAMLGVMFGVMWRVDRALTLVALLVAVPLGVLIRVFYRPMSERAAAQEELQSGMMVHAERVLSAVPLVQSFTREEAEDARFRAAADAALTAYVKTTLAQLWFKLGTGAVTATGTAVVMVFGGLHVLNGSLTIGSLLVFLAYLSSLYAPLETLAYLSTTLASATAGAKRVTEVLASDERVTERPGAIAAPQTGAGGADVALEGVTFGYEPDRAVLHDVTLRLAAGEALAIIGRTGAGKSTLAALVPRLLDPWDGRVLLDGRDVRELTLASLRQRVAVVPQEPLLLPLTIADNIAYGRPDATRAEIEAAAESAGAAEFITALPNGYETILGERGCTLSAGQRQRLAIARALLKQAAVLVLDEPTAALDVRTERGVMSAVQRLKGERTVILIAHRLSTARVANRVAVIEDGRIVRQGSPHEVLGDDDGAEDWFDQPVPAADAGVLAHE